MSSRILKSVGPLALLVGLAVPATAQIPLPPLPHLQIRIGRTAPPPIRYERVTVRPSRDVVWIKGFWDWDGDEWRWAPGRWERPERRNVRWIAPRYFREGPGWHYEPGHWSHQRLAEADDHRQWRSEHSHDRNWRRYHRDYDRYDRDRDRDHDRDHR
ncbi:MAG: hypothetical protein ABIT01_07710 [Thermoanaerobaculia bacterium]